MTDLNAGHQFIRDLMPSVSLAMSLSVVVLLDRGLTEWISPRSSEPSSPVLIASSRIGSSESIATPSTEPSDGHFSRSSAKTSRTQPAGSERRLFGKPRADRNQAYITAQEHDGTQSYDSKQEHDRSQEESPGNAREAGSPKTAGGLSDAEETGGNEVQEKEAAPQPVQFDLPRLNERVLDFAESHRGKQVGRGECWDLADQALRATGAEAPRGYAFGTRIDIDDVMPGDIIQFTSARFEEAGRWLLMGVPNHTAIVRAVNGNRIFLLHQNVNGERVVQLSDINLKCMVSGKLTAFRPRIPASDD